jgi:two-component system chemotaxis sensor kinase CheA
MYALVVKAFDIIVAIGIDQVLNEQQIFVKGLGKQLTHVKNITAATVMEWGKVVPILDPYDLIKSISQFNGKTLLQDTEEISVRKKRILIAEDSVTARVLIKNILESAGFEVKAAVDGAEALSIIKTEEFDLLLSDVEMPRMDGFKLTETIRSIEKYKDLPIVLCTSRGSREDREHGIEVGANAYINKNDFSQSYLLEIISNFF